MHCLSSLKVGVHKFAMSYFQRVASVQLTTVQLQMNQRDLCTRGCICV